MTWITYFCLQLVFVIMVMGVGYALSQRIERWVSGAPFLWIDRVCVAAVIIICVLAALGGLIAISPWQWRSHLGVLGVLSLLIGSVFLIICRRYYRDALDASPAERTYFFGYILLCGISLALALWPAKLPDQLVDGPYVVKRNVLGVKVQYITGDLPADNSIPHVVSEYLLRGISFALERPVMPGQEVSNRPILASLVIIPFRAATHMPRQLVGRMPRFEYVGSDWPDFSVLMNGRSSYLVSLSIGIVLNGLLFLALGMFGVRISGSDRMVASGVLFMVLTSPYFLFQTMFTWPKELAAFFVLLAYISAQNLRSPLFSGVCLGLGYLSHPYVVVFLAAHVVWVLFCSMYIFIDRENSPKNDILLVAGCGVRTVVSFLIVIAPWFLWTKLWLGIPSDLVAQNFFQPGQNAINFLWVRVINTVNLISAGHLMNYPFNIRNFVPSSALNIPGAIGLSVFVFLLRYAFSGFSLRRDFVHMVYWIFPVLMLVIVFSNQAVPALHGLQGPIALLLLIGVASMAKILRKSVFFAVIGVQFVANSVFLGRYFVGLL